MNLISIELDLEEWIEILLLLRDEERRYKMNEMEYDAEYYANIKEEIYAQLSLEKKEP